MSAQTGSGDTSLVDKLPALSGTWIQKLDLPNDNAAFVTLPLGAREPRPLIVAVHGAGDRPEWACGGWRLASKSFAFVVCPRGSTYDAQRYAWGSARQIQEAVELAVRAVREHFARYLADGPMIYAGFSQGATLAEATLTSSSERFPLVIFAEGGYDLSASKHFAEQLRERGTQRIMLVCGGAGCFTHAKSAETGLERAGLDVQIAGDPRSGHNLNERMQVALRESWPNFVAGIPNWRAFTPSR